MPPTTALLIVDSDIVSTEEKECDDNCSAHISTPSNKSGGVSTTNNKSVKSANNASVDSSSNTALSLKLADDTSISIVSVGVRGGLKASEVRKAKAAVQRRFSEDDRSSDFYPRSTLDFESVPLVGRGKEVSKLKACFERIMETPKGDSQSTFGTKKELVFIAGTSGAGKSVVALTLRKRVVECTDGMFVVGKFDMNMSSEPFFRYLQSIR